jgi:hypothetical protein
MYMMLAMAMMGGMGGMSSGCSVQRQRPQRKLSPEEEAEILKERQAKFLSDLEKLNVERKQNFKKFKEYEVYGLKIIAFSQKNALRDINNLMHQNLIRIKENV